LSHLVKTLKKKVNKDCTKLETMKKIKNVKKFFIFFSAFYFFSSFSKQ
jgi:hypothetical protein